MKGKMRHPEKYLIIFSAQVPYKFLKVFLLRLVKAKIASIPKLYQRLQKLTYILPKNWWLHGRRFLGGGFKCDKPISSQMTLTASIMQR